MNKQSYVYILFNKRNGTLYTGVTSNLIQRINQHKSKTHDGFTKKYNIDKLGYYEIFNDMHNAIAREKRIKAGSRANKVALIEQQNPEWRDLWDDITRFGY